MPLLRPLHLALHMLPLDVRHDDASAPHGVGAILVGEGSEELLPDCLTTAPSPSR